MSKRERYRRDLTVMFEAYFETDDAERLLTHIVKGSNLPGPRANLELAQAFADLVASHAEEKDERVWTLCVRMADTSPSEAPVNTPLEFIPFCGAVGIGAIGSAWNSYFQPALLGLRELATDPRWRMREAVRFGLQRMLASHARPTIQALEEWVVPGDWLRMRAVATTVAEPRLLEDPETARKALQLHQEILSHLVAADDRRSVDFRVLRQGLGYTLSVITCAVPDEGFFVLEELVDSDDSDVLWIVKQNMKKRRLTEPFPEEVRSIQNRLAL